MLQNVVYLLSALFMLGYGQGGPSKESCYLGEEKHDIIVRPLNAPPINSPRSPSAVRIEAYYDEAISSVCSFLTNAGTAVAVNISNLDTGETMSCSIPGSGFSVIPISGTTGEWVITYTLSNTMVYIGTFLI